ncbi:MAG: tetratricopeptide repeat protein [Pirellulales bacterium]
MLDSAPPASPLSPPAAASESGGLMPLAGSAVQRDHKMVEALANSQTLRELQELDRLRDDSNPPEQEGASEVEEQAKPQVSVLLPPLYARSRKALLAASITTALTAAGFASWAGYHSFETQLKLEQTAREKSETLTRLGEALDRERLANVRIQELKEATVQIQDLSKFVDSVMLQSKRMTTENRDDLLKYKRRVLEECLPRAERLADSIPLDHPDAVRDKIAKLLDVAELYTQLLDGPKATKVWTDLVELTRMRVQQKSGSDASRNNLLLMLSKLAAVESEINRNIASAVRHYREAAEVAESIVDEPRKDSEGKGALPRYRTLAVAAENEHKLGVTLFRLGDSVQALEALQRSQAASDTFRKTVRELVLDPDLTSEAAKQEKASVDSLKKLDAEREYLREATLARIYHQIGRDDDAIVLAKGVALRSELQLAADPGSVRVQREAIGAFSNLGLILFESGHQDEAREILRRSAIIARILLGNNPANAEYIRACIMAYYEYARAMTTVDESIAQKWGTEAVRLIREQVETQENNDRLRMYATRIEARFGSTKTAIAKATEFYESGKQDSEMMLESARSLAICADRLPEKRWQLQEQSARAIELAVQIGLRDHCLLTHDTDLNGVQQHAAYAGIVSGLIRAADVRATDNRR